MKRVVLVSVLALAACAGAGSKQPAKVSLSFQAQLDSGNAAYRRGDFQASTKWFHEAAHSDSANLSGWYGIYMAESKLGNAAEAKRAQEIVAKEAPYMPMTHPTAGDHMQQQKEKAPNGHP